ncbi:MAG: hypothetical protein RLZZ117_225 [Cyanobacteriota bacterium]
MRAKIVLACASGEQSKTVAERFGVSMMKVGKWRQRYLDQGVTGLHDELRPGRPRSYNDEEVANVINLVLQTKPNDGSTHWSIRTGVYALWQQRRESPNQRYNVGCKHVQSSLIAKTIS